MSLSHRYPALLLCAFVAAAAGCQSAKQTAFMPPVQAQAPAIVAGATPNSNQQKAASNKAASQTAGSQTNASQANSQAAQALAVDPVADLIARVEKEYLAGQENYRAGHLEAAKQDFDSAFNQLLGSGFDLQSDDRLENELNRILDGTNDLELAALQQGDGFSEQPSEPAPIDEANEATPAVDQNVKAKAEAEIKSTRSDLPLMMTDQVAGYINYFSNRGRGTIERALSRSGQYDEMIRRTLKQEGVPQDLIYLAQAESGFHPLAVSRAGARGIWQFMASRAKGYGLERSWWLDERQDPEKSTRAAAHHLKDLYNQFGDWYLAMAAYNSGPGTVQSAVKRTGYADFWELYRRNVLPKETRNYVPIILAVTIMAKNPEQYGLASVAKEKPLAYDTVKIDYPIDLRLAAECVDASAADLQDLNPSLLRMTTPKDHAFELHLPAGTGKTFQGAVASIPVDKRVWWRYHKVQAGETLASIARAYHTAPKSIAQANDLNANDEALAPESRLIIPIAPGKQNDTSTYARAITHYKIRKGDTVESVAENFGVSPKMIRTWNRLKGVSLSGRRILLLHLPISPGARDTQVASKSSHKSLVNNSSAHNASSRKKTVASTQHPATSPSHAQTQTSSAGTSVLHHKVKPGETLYSIASSYNTTVSALKKDNRNVAVLRPGMILVVHDVR
ncbi:MAG: transglycosylase SLT domain-containing protein [Terriglobales bacterium]